jgi:hypothetical protein
MPQGKAERPNRVAREPAGPDQAKAAINLYGHKINGTPINELLLAGLSDEDRRDAHAMAAALILIRKLLDQYNENVNSSAEGRESGLIQAYDLLDVLTTGHDWPPFWRFIDGLRSAAFRPQKAPPSAFENQRRSIIAGFVRAIQHVAEQDGQKISQTKAIQSVIDICKFPGVAFTVDQIRNWSRQSKDRGGEGPAKAASMILGEATKQAEDSGLPLSECVGRVGLTSVYNFWSVPVIT